jgi:hypothetical protein
VIKLRLAGALAAALLISACASISAAPAGPYKVGDAMSVTLGRQWNDASRAQVGAPRRVRLLTIDGPLLNRLYFTTGLRPGDFLVKPERRETPTPTYRTNMAPTELVEFVADSVAALKYQRVETSALRPTPRGRQPTGLAALRGGHGGDLGDQSEGRGSSCAARRLFCAGERGRKRYGWGGWEGRGGYTRIRGVGVYYEGGSWV